MSLTVHVTAILRILGLFRAVIFWVGGKQKKTKATAIVIG